MSIENIDGLPETIEPGQTGHSEAHKVIHKWIKAFNNDQYVVRGFTDQDITDALTSGKSKIYFPAGTWNVNTQFNVPSAVSTIELHPACIIIQNAVNKSVFVRARASAPAGVNITSGATEGSTKITVDATTGITVGSWIHLTSEDEILGGATSKRGMLRRVESISGKDITIDRPLHRDLTTGAQARPGNITKPLALIGSGQIRQADSLLTTSTSSLVTFSHTERPIVSGSITFGPSAAAGVMFDTCVSPVVNGGFFRDLGKVASTRSGGHGIILAGSTIDARIIQGEAVRVRHGVTTLPGGNTYGEPENCIVETGYAVRNSVEAGLDTHEQGYGIVFRPNVVGCWHGVQVRSRGSIVEPGIIKNSENWGLIVRPSASETKVGATLIHGAGRTTVTTGAILIESQTELRMTSISDWGTDSTNKGIWVKAPIDAFGLNMDGKGYGTAITLESSNTEIQKTSIKNATIGISELNGFTNNKWLDISFDNVVTHMSVQKYNRVKNSSDRAAVVKNASSALRTSTLTLDSELQMTLNPGTIYKFTATVFYDSSQTADIKFGLTLPTGATAEWSAFGLTQGATSTAGSFQAASKSGTDSIQLGAAGAGTPTSATINGVLSTGSSGGVFGLKWAQATTEDADTILKPLSNLIVERLA